MPATLSNGQAELRVDTDDALVIGDGTLFPWTMAGPGWWATGEVRTSDQARSGADGVVAGRDLGGKHVTNLRCSMLAESEAHVGELIDLWKAATAPSEDAIETVRLNALGRTRRRFGRFRISEADATLAESGWVAVGGAQFESFDGITYGDELHTATTGRKVEGAGVTMPITLPFTLPASTSTGIASITNNGNRRSTWTARLDGPLDAITIRHLESGRRLDLSLTANGGLTLAGGEFVEINSADESILLGGTSDRRDRLTIDSQWWDFDRGTNTFELTADSGTGTLTVSGYDAFHS